MTGRVFVDASAVPDFASGVRTRLRGLIEAYHALADAPELLVAIAEGATLLGRAAVGQGPVKLVQVPRPGGPWRRVLGAGALGPAANCPVWHSETLPVPAPSVAPVRLLTLHDVRWHGSAADSGVNRVGHWFRAGYARRWLPRRLRTLTKLITVSGPAAQRMQQAYGIPPEQIAVIENAAAATVPGVPAVTREEVHSRYWLPPRFVLGVGHLNGRKGFDLALEALAAAPIGSLLRKTVLCLVGEGRGRERLKKLASDLDVSDRVRWAGRVDEFDLAALYAEAAAFLFPSRVEGFGFPVYEALAAGCPVIARPLDVLTDLKSDAVQQPGAAPEQWAAAIDAVLAEPERYRTAASELAASLQEFTWDRSARKLAALYRECLSTAS